MTVELHESTDMGKLMDNLAIELHRKASVQAVRADVRIAANRAKQLVPRGKLSHKPEKPPLHSTIKVAVRDYGQVIFGIMGAAFPAGAHAWLVEYGHIKHGTPKPGTTARVEGKEFMAPAVDQTKTERFAAVVRKYKEVAAKASGLGRSSVVNLR